MPARRRKQSSAMLYTLITFVGLFIASTTVAVIYYVKAEENRQAMQDASRARDELANDQERQAIGTIVGEKKGQRTARHVSIYQEINFLNIILAAFLIWFLAAIGCCSMAWDKRTRREWLFLFLFTLALM